jgi:hypothetical protein
MAMFHGRNLGKWMKMIRNRVDQLSFQMTIERLKASTNFQNLMSDQQNDARNTTSGFQPCTLLFSWKQAVKRFTAPRIPGILCQSSSIFETKLWSIRMTLDLVTKSKSFQSHPISLSVLQRHGKNGSSMSS